MLSTIAEIIRDLLIFVGVITALLITLVVVVSRMPDTNPLKRGTDCPLLSPWRNIGGGSYRHPGRAHPRN